VVVTYDGVCFDEARNGFEHALCAVGLLLAPEGKAFGKVLVTRFFFEYKRWRERVGGHGRPLVRTTLDSELKGGVELSPSFARCRGCHDTNKMICVAITRSR
jgi:hypothetical protein